MISNLPDDIKYKILELLPVQEAVQTSVLSKQWCHKWASMPTIFVSELNCVSPTLGDTYAPRLEKFVDKLLLLHKGPLKSFQLFTGQCRPPAFDQWMRVLSRLGIIDLHWVLVNYEVEYRIPSIFFSFDALETVYLCNFLLKVPQHFNGFKALRSMELLKCTSTTADLTKQLSNCPVLESLVLISMKVSIGLKIRAPRLKMLIINGSFAYVQLEAPMLANAKILLRNSDTCCLGKNGGKSNLEEALGSLVHIEKLKMKEDFVKYLAKGCLPDHLPYMFNHLKKVSIKLNFHRFKEIRVACILFHNALNLQDLYILADPSTLTKEEDPSTFTSFWDTEASHGLVFNQLKTIFMEQYEACEPILAFVKLILGSAPLLEKMILRESTIYEEDENGNLTQITLDLDKSTKASTKAAIIFE
ncbi:F-box/RNI-like superfamily protein [Rhynchospora pubera]|uniref:F-box/RNI-like superfamily protein n=1 Tax=Rhynchospora pubera TaxID=906938 RepID=A0AAV8FP42_9POAL|nr:F-box/RNI-like superfamily protein [Rhynchospora pubera]